MLDRLVDAIVDFLDLFRFWEVVDHFEEGVVLRLGKYRCKCGPGFHWIAPFGIDQVLTENVVLDTIDLGPQSLTTSDGRDVVISGVVSWKIRDIKKVLLDVDGAESVLTDSAYGLIQDAVEQSQWEDVRTAEFTTAVTKAVRSKAFAWGIEVTAVQFRDKSKCRSLRLWNEQAGE